MTRLRITYDAPVVLTFALAAVIVYLLPGTFADARLDTSSLRSWFVAYPTLALGAHSYVGLFSHILGHVSWAHLLGNFMLILLIGPMLEKRYGSIRLLVMILTTALVTGLVNIALSSHVVLGASGVAFMMILLASTANIRRREIPLTFIAVAALYLGGELYREVASTDQISHLAHLVGGVAGAVFGFLSARTAPSRTKDGRAARIIAGSNRGFHAKYS